MEETTRKDDKRGEAEKGLTGQQTMFQVVLFVPNTLQTEDSPYLSDWKEAEEVGEKPDSAVSSAGTKIGMIPLYDGSKIGEELHDDRSESTNAKSVIRLDNGALQMTILLKLK